MVTSPIMLLVEKIAYLMLHGLFGVIRSHAVAFDFSFLFIVAQADGPVYTQLAYSLANLTFRISHCSYRVVVTETELIEKSVE